MPFLKGNQIIFKSSISEMRIAVARVVPEVIQETAEAAKNNINQETKRQHSGRYYPSRREPGAMHQASKPGESFATDTAGLVGGMQINRLAPLTTEIQFHDELGINRWAIFEFGGGRIAARPTIVPIFEHMKDGYIHDISRALLHELTALEVK